MRTLIHYRRPEDGYEGCKPTVEPERGTVQRVEDDQFGACWEIDVELDNDGELKVHFERPARTSGNVMADPASTPLTIPAGQPEIWYFAGDVDAEKRPRYLTELEPRNPAPVGAQSETAAAAARSHSGAAGLPSGSTKILRSTGSADQVPPAPVPADAAEALMERAITAFERAAAALDLMAQKKGSAAAEEAAQSGPTRDEPVALAKSQVPYAAKAPAEGEPDTQSETVVQTPTKDQAPPEGAKEAAPPDAAKE